MKNLTEPGQIKAGDTIVLSFKGEGQVHTASQILCAGTDKEEVLLDLDLNLYFITSMAIDGTSWAKEVKFSG